jgi:hypothetical protein
VCKRSGYFSLTFLYRRWHFDCSIIRRQLAVQLMTSSNTGSAAAGRENCELHANHTYRIYWSMSRTSSGVSSSDSEAGRYGFIINSEYCPVSIKLEPQSPEGRSRWTHSISLPWSCQLEAQRTRTDAVMMCAVLCLFTYSRVTVTIDGVSIDMDLLNTY